MLLLGFTQENYSKANQHRKHYTTRVVRHWHAIGTEEQQLQDISLNL